MVVFVDVLDMITKPPVSSAIAGLLALLSLILTIVWVKTYQPCHWTKEDGYSAFSWDPGGDGPFGGKFAGCVFNWHPVLMVASMVTGTTLAALCYHAPNQLKKSVAKPLHAAVLFLSFILMCSGLRAVFKYHDNKHIENMVSFHSWVGMFSVLIFSAQLVTGAYHFLPGPDAGVPGVNAETKGRYLPLHVTAGVLALVLPVATSGIGIMEKMGFVDRFGTDGFNPDKHKVDGKVPEDFPGVDAGKKHDHEISYLNYLGIWCAIGGCYEQHARTKQSTSSSALTLFLCAVPASQAIVGILSGTSRLSSACLRVACACSLFSSFSQSVAAKSESVGRKNSPSPFICPRFG